MIEYSFLKKILYSFIFFTLIVATVFYYFETKLNFDEKIGLVSTTYINKQSNTEDKLDIYRKIHKDILTNVTLNGKRVYALTPSKIGYANRMYVLLSGLLMAILSDSACIMHVKDADEFIEQPLYKAFEHINPRYKFKYITVEPHERITYRKNIDLLINTKIPDELRNESDY